MNPFRRMTGFLEWVKTVKARKQAKFVHDLLKWKSIPLQTLGLPHHHSD
jgi:hypothetical protein